MQVKGAELILVDVFWFELTDDNSLFAYMIKRERKSTCSKVRCFGGKARGFFHTKVFSQPEKSLSRTAGVARRIEIIAAKTKS